MATDPSPPPSPPIGSRWPYAVAPQPTPPSKWQHFFLSLVASLPALIAAIAAFVQSMSNGAVSQSNAMMIEQTRAHVADLHKMANGILPEGPEIVPADGHAVPVKPRKIEKEP